MDFLQAEIEKKRKALDEYTLKTGKSKYVKRGDLEQFREEAYIREQREKEELKVKEYLALSEAAEKKRAYTASVNINETFENEDVVMRLRLRGQPVRLFGESNEERIVRLKECEVKEIRVKGQSNELLAALRSQEKGMAEDLMKGKQPETIKEVNEVAQVAEADVDTTKINLELLKSNAKLTALLIVIYFKKVNTDWGVYLQDRDEEEKRMAEGRLKAALHAQTVLFMKPLYKRLKKRNLPQEYWCLI
jgi:pre-mRNA-splicing factor 18